MSAQSRVRTVWNLKDKRKKKPVWKGQSLCPSTKHSLGPSKKKQELYVHLQFQSQAPADTVASCVQIFLHSSDSLISS